MINTSLRHFCSSPKIVGIRKLSTFHILSYKAMETSQADRPMGNVNKPNMNIDKKTYVTRRDVNEEVKENRGKELKNNKETVPIALTFLIFSYFLTQGPSIQIQQETF